MLAYSARMSFEQGGWGGGRDDAEAVLQHPRTTSDLPYSGAEDPRHLRISTRRPDTDSPLEEARTLAGPTPELQRLGTLAAVCAEAAWLAGDRAGIIREYSRPTRWCAKDAIRG